MFEQLEKLVFDKLLNEEVISTRCIAFYKQGGIGVYILQLSDFHISENGDLTHMSEKIDLLCTKLRTLLPTGSQLLCCILGDVPDKGVPGAYTTAKALIAELKRSLEEVVGQEKLAFEIIPGNHDLCEEQGRGKTLSAFNDFASSILGRSVSYADQCSVHDTKHFGYQIICVSSVLSGETKFGKINIEKLRECTISPNAIMLTHHSLVSDDDNDQSVIRSGYHLQKFLEENSFLALLHGHTHGCRRSTIGNDCQVIGVGSLLKDESTYEIWNQCNLINIVGSAVREVRTLAYHADRGGWVPDLIYSKNEDNNYYCDNASVYALYSKILLDAEANSLLPNLRIQIKAPFSKFESEITTQFAPSEQDARAWQSAICPDFLEYTHCQLMNTSFMTWDKFAVDSLQKKPTSKRTIIPLIEKEKAFNATDDKKLVSFDVVQFGFTSDECKDLHVTVYMRALEVRYFLPINLYEIYLIMQKIRKQIRTIENVTVCIFAFRAEAQDHYGCYKKATIDLMSESSLCRLISDGSIEKLIELLEEKRKMSDTVIDMTWLKKFKCALETFYEESNREAVLVQVDNVFATLEQLKARREHCSNYSETQNEYNTFECELQKLEELLGKAYDKKI